MNIETLREYCLSKNGVSESFPFDQKTLVFKVLDKMFALTSVDSIELSINLKCDPEKSIELREMYSFINPGYHMNKKHWNTIDIDNGVEEILIKQLIDHSYDLVVSKMTKKQKESLKNEN